MSIIDTIKGVLGLDRGIDLATIKTATEFFAWQKSIGSWDSWTGEQRSVRKKLFQALSSEERYLVQREGIDDFFVETNRCTEGPGVPVQEHVSPSGRYRLMVTSYGTGKGAWRYTRGEVFRVVDGHLGERVADVKRNYTSFPFSWMEGHPKGDFLIAGNDYQGQMFCELTTGRMKSHIPDEAFDGHGFCWATHRLLEDGHTLFVDGCYWACPYECRFFDVSDPMEGWPELKTPGHLDLDPEGGTVTYEDGLIVWSGGERIFKATEERESVVDSVFSGICSTIFHAERKGKSEEVAAAKAALEAHSAKYPDESEDVDKWSRVVDRIVRLRREGGALVLVSEWKSEHLMKQERRQEEYAQEDRARRLGWIDADSLLSFLGGVVGPDKLRGLTGFMYPSGVMREDGDKNPAYFRISAEKHDPEKERNHWATIGWGVVEGEITVELSVRGKGTVGKPEFPRTSDGVVEAWIAAQRHLASELLGDAL